VKAMTLNGRLEWVGIGCVTSMNASTQVHEKSILLVTVPATLLILDHPDVVAWFILTANFRWVHRLPPQSDEAILTRVNTLFRASRCCSMYPLLKRDGLALAYAATMAAWLLAWRYLRSTWVPPTTVGRSRTPVVFQRLIRLAIPVCPQQDWIKIGLDEALMLTLIEHQCGGRSIHTVAAVDGWHDHGARARRLHQPASAVSGPVHHGQCACIGRRILPLSGVLYLPPVAPE